MDFFPSLSIHKQAPRLAKAGLCTTHRTQQHSLTDQNNVVPCLSYEDVCRTDVILHFHPKSLVWGEDEGGGEPSLTEMAEKIRLIPYTGI